jgi:hypothetical protein
MKYSDETIWSMWSMWTNTPKTFTSVLENTVVLDIDDPILFGREYHEILRFVPIARSVNNHDDRWRLQPNALPPPILLFSSFVQQGWFAGQAQGNFGRAQRMPPPPVIDIVTIPSIPRGSQRAVANFAIDMMNPCLMFRLDPFFISERRLHLKEMMFIFTPLQGPPPPAVRVNGDDDDDDDYWREGDSGWSAMSAYVLTFSHQCRFTFVGADLLHPEVVQVYHLHNDRHEALRASLHADLAAATWGVRYRRAVVAQGIDDIRFYTHDEYRQLATPEEYDLYTLPRPSFYVGGKWSTEQDTWPEAE